MEPDKTKRKGMHARTYSVLSMAVEDGVNYAWGKAHKHSDDPTEEQVKSAMIDAVLSSIGDWFIIDDEDDLH